MKTFQIDTHDTYVAHTFIKAESEAEARRKFEDVGNGQDIIDSNLDEWIGYVDKNGQHTTNEQEAIIGVKEV